MKRLRISATVRVAIGLAFIATTVLLVSYSIGMIPDVNREKAKGRLAQCETIAMASAVKISRLMPRWTAKTCKRVYLSNIFV